MLLIFASSSPTLFPVMARPEITPAAAFGIIAQRLEKRIQVLQNMRLDGYSMVISELDLVLRQVRKAQQYFVSTYSETTVRPHNGNLAPPTLRRVIASKCFPPRGKFWIPCVYLDDATSRYLDGVRNSCMTRHNIVHHRNAF